MRAWATAFLSVTTAVVIGSGSWHSGEAPAPAPRAAQSSGNVIATAPVKRANPDKAKTGTRKAQNQCGIPEDSFQADLRNLLRRGVAAAGTGDDQSCSITVKDAGTIRILFALLPDPAHTNLPLFFDRQIDALQQGAQDSGWMFDESAMPWDNKEHPESTDFRTRDAQEQAEKEKQKQPGLVIFHRLPGPDRPLEHLLVFVIAESPTGGIHKEQFRNALGLTKELMGKSPIPLYILGPTFSGSLQSLSEFLQECGGKQCGPATIYSGTISDCSAVAIFQKQKYESKVEIQSLQEYDDNVISRFLEFAKQRQYAPEQIAILSEDETTYGYRPPETSQNSKCAPDTAEATAAHLYFPREISQLRKAYQHNAEAALNKGQRTTLPLNLESSGNPDDTVRQYSRNQLPLSQEAVLLGLVAELKKHNSELVLVRATDPFDQLFLARFLRQAYPRGRIIVIGADLLFSREIQDASLHGVMALSTYNPVPGAEHDFAHNEMRAPASGTGEHLDRIFPSSNSAGTYNATKLLLNATLSPTEVKNLPNSRLCSQVPRVHLVQYRSPRGQSSFGETEWRPSRPPVYLSVLGHDGFWDVAIFPESEAPIGLVKTFFRDLHDELFAPCPDCSASASRPATQPPDNLPLVCDPEELYTINSGEAASINASNQMDLPKDWQVFWIIVIGISLLYAYFVWTASVLSTSEAVAHLAPPYHDSRRYLFISTAYLHFLLLATVLWPYEYFSRRAPVEFLVVAFAAVAVMIVGFADIYRRGARRLSWVFAVACLATCIAILFVWQGDYVDYMFVWRSVNLTSGVSPLLSILLLLFAGLWALWSALSGASLVGMRRPALPRNSFVPGQTSPAIRDAIRPILQKDQTRLLQYIDPNFWDLRALVAMTLVILVFLELGHSLRPIHTLERPGYELLLALLIAFTLSLLVRGLMRLQSIWTELRRLLQSLDMFHLGQAFKDLTGFAWSPLWRMGSGDILILRKIIRSKLEAAQAIRNARFGSQEFQTAVKDTIKQGKQVREVYGIAMDYSLRSSAWQLLRSPINWFRRINEQGELETKLIKSTWKAQRRVARVGAHALAFVAEQRSRSNAINGQKGEKRTLAGIITTATRTALINRKRDIKGLLSDKCNEEVRLCEHLLALIYTDFILVVVIRIRTLAMSIAGVYVLLLLALSVYPFQPQLGIRAWLMVLLGIIVAVVGMIYAQMHRDSVLSYITDTKPGELGSDFWVRIVSFVALPLLSLLASQFPEIGGTISSWLEPAMHALK